MSKLAEIETHCLEILKTESVKTKAREEAMKETRQLRFETTGLWFTQDEERKMHRLAKTPGMHPFTIMNIWGLACKSERLLIGLHEAGAFKSIPFVAITGYEFLAKANLGFVDWTKIPVGLLESHHREKWELRLPSNMSDAEVVQCWKEAALISSFYPGYFQRMDDWILKYSRISDGVVETITNYKEQLAEMFPIAGGKAHFALPMQEYLDF